MANRIKGEAEFSHNGTTRKLVVNMDVLLAAEDETGVGILEVVASGRVGWLASLLRHALVAGGGKLLLRTQSAELIMLSEEARKAVQAAFNNAMPRPPADDDDDVGGSEGNG